MAAKSIKEFSGSEVNNNGQDRVLDYSSLDLLPNITTITVLHIKDYYIGTGDNNQTETILEEGTHFTNDTNSKELTLLDNTVSGLTIDTTLDKIALLRTTDISSPSVSFADTSLLTDTNLNQAVRQSLFKLQELSEQQADGYDTTALALTGTINSNKNSITAITANDFVTQTRIATGAVGTNEIEDGTIQGTDLNISSVKAAIGDVLYPLGSVYCNMLNTQDPATLLGFGSWTRIEGRVIVGYNTADTDFDNLLETGGSKTHTLTVDEMPSHTHTVGIQSINDRDDDENKHTIVSGGSTTTSSTGGDQPHNNLQPYITGSLWYRSA